MLRILGWGALRRRRRGKSSIILFKCSPLRQCALALFRFLFCSDLWPFGSSINTTTRMQEDVPFPRFVLLRRVFKKFYGAKIKMSSTVFKVFVSLTALCCATADLQCNFSVGLESRELPNRLIDASSYLAAHNPYLGRLNNQVRKINETKTVWGAWCAQESNTNQYIQVDLEHVRNITGIATQGYDYGAAVTLYKIMYSINEKQWFNYKENSTDKIFKGNEDRDTIVRHEFNRLLAARFIRFNPWTWRQMICMRVEIYACSIPQKVSTTAATTTGKPTTKKSVIDFRTTERLGKLVTHAETTEKGTKYQESSTSMQNISFDDERKNAASSDISCSFSLLFACIVLVLSKLL